MFSSLIARCLASGLDSIGAATFRAYANAIGKQCGGAVPCKTKFPVKNCEPVCKARIPNCPKASCNCPKVPEHVCPELPYCCGSDRLTRDPCYEKGAKEFVKKDMKSEKRMNIKTSAWEYPADCCGNPCPELLPRFDTLYYKPKNKAEMQCQQTWVDFPPLKPRPRRACNETTELPPFYRREKKRCPLTACEFDFKTMTSFTSTGKCPRTVVPCCIRGRFPATCNKERGLSNCKKRCCPFPAFSESCHPYIPPPAPNECICLKIPYSCVAYKYLRRKQIFKLPPNLPNWPPQLEGPYFKPN